MVDPDGLALQRWAERVEGVAQTLRTPALRGEQERTLSSSAAHEADWWTTCAKHQVTPRPR